MKKKFRVTLELVVEGGDDWTEQEAIDYARPPHIEFIDGKAEEI